jgi:hypothetical protein
MLRNRHERLEWSNSCSRPEWAIGRARPVRVASRPRRNALVALGIGLVLFLACAAAANAGRYGGAPLPRDVRIDRLVVYKGDGRMEAYAGDVLMKEYAIAVGSGGGGPKTYEGDGRTPEGTYRIDSRHRSRRFQYFLHVSYPNADDRRRYRDARAAGEVPDGAGIGGDIGVHGTPSDLPPFAFMFDWTAGCIAVDNDSARELYRAVADDAVIEIRP